MPLRQSRVTTGGQRIHDLTSHDAACQGRVNRNVAPCGTFPSAQMRPPCASMIERQIDSSIPMPLGLVV